MDPSGAERSATEPGSEPTRGGQILRYRDFGLLRWVALLLMVGGVASCGSLAFWTPAWWASAVVAVVGLVLLEVDNRKRRAHLRSWPDKGGTTR